MAAQIIVKATGKASEAASNSIELDAPSVVRLDVDQSQVANLERAGDDLVVRLTDGQAIRVEQYYVQNNGVGSDLVLRDGAQRLWLAHPEVAGAGRFTLLGELNDLVAAGGAVAASFACRLVDPNQPGLGDSTDQISSASFHAYEFHDVYLVRRSGLEGWQRRYLKDDYILVQFAITVLLGEPKNAVASDAGPPPSVPSSDLHRQFGELLRSQKGVDVTFHVSGESVPAHRSVLATRSPVFMAQLYGHTKEASTSAPCVEVKDMEAEVFRAMLRFIYTDTAPELERSGWQATAMAQHLLEAADLYGLERLKRMCEEKVSMDISVGNVATTLALAEQHGCAKLKASCIEFILAAPENLFALAATEGYEHVD